MVMYMEEAGEEAWEGTLPRPAGATLIGVMIAAIVVLTFLLGILPEEFLRSAATALPAVIAGI